MDKKKLIYFALVSLFMLPSCSQEDSTGRGLPIDGNIIYFRSYLPTVSLSRAGEINSGNFNTCQVTGFNLDDNSLIDPATEKITPYFHDISFAKDENGMFIAEGGDEYRWPDSRSRLHFFAYYPSVESMKGDADDDFFTLHNNTRLEDGTPVLDYSLKNFIVSREIANQVDFVTSYATGTLSDNKDSGIALNFKHQLARVEMAAWSNGEKYDFEIAGIRIGNPLATGDFNFSAIADESGQSSLWSDESQATVEHIYTPGENIVSIGRSATDHKSAENAVSVMGTAGPAMVIPMATKIEAWEGKNDPDIESADYSTDKLYFSVLVRVKNKEGDVVYPYPNDRDNMTVIYFAVDNEGKITKSLKKIGDTYYTDDDIVFLPSQTEQICGFGWASLPVAARWEAGKIYRYKLNYSEGIGWHDPDDPNPGEPIIERGKVPFDVNVEEWLPASNDEYDPDLTVPKR